MPLLKTNVTMVINESKELYAVKNKKTGGYITAYDKGYMASGICTTQEQAFSLLNFLCKICGFDYHDLCITKLA